MIQEKERVLKALKDHPWCVEEVLSKASEEVMLDKEVILTIVKNGVLWYASQKLRDHRGIIMEAVQINGLTLCYASPRLKSDVELVLEAVRNNGHSLQYASALLKRKRHIVLEAVKNHVGALYHASEDLKNDRSIVHDALSSVLMRNGFKDLFEPISLYAATTESTDAFSSLTTSYYSFSHDDGQHRLSYA